MLDQNQMASLTSELDGSIRRAASRLETEFRAADRKIIDTVSTIAGDKSEEAQVDPEQPLIEAATKSEIPFEILVDYTNNSPTVYVRNGGFYGEDMFAGTDGSNTFETFDYMTLDTSFGVSKSVWATLVIDDDVWTASLNTEEQSATGTEWVRNVLVGTIGSNGEVLQTVTGHIPADYGEVFARLDGSNQPFTGPIAAPALTLDPAGSAVTGEGALTWNPDDLTLNIDTGLGPVLQTGQEHFVIVYNDTGIEIPNGSVCKTTGIFGGRATIGLITAEDSSQLQSGILITTMAIPDATYGIATDFGRVRGFDTTAIPGTGPLLWLSPDTPGGMTLDKPEFPDYPIFIGAISVLAEDGTIGVDISGSVEDTFVNFHNGTFRETFDFLITSTGGVVTGSLTPANGHPDMTMLFSSGQQMLTATPAATIVLTPGADDNPQTNYVYIPESTKVLTVSTSDWPTTVEHIKVAQVFLQTASTTASNGALRNQNWNDAVENTHTFQGHLSHITERIRQIPAAWDSGAETSVVINAGAVYVSNTAGVVYQMHRQAFPVLDMETGDNIHVVNDSTTAYTTVTDLSDIALDASGASLNNTSFSIVVWGVCNKSGEASHLMANMPTGTYSKNFPDQALEDAKAYTVYSVPKAFNGVGFLMARLTFVNSGGTWTLHDNTDLRGKIPDTEAGSAGGTGVTTFTALTDTPSTYIGSELWFVRVNAGGTALEFSQIDHDTLTNVTPDQHHSQSHTVASHSDTTATGSELETLTDGSNADALHAHAHAAMTGQGTDDHHAQSHTLGSHSDVTVVAAAQYHVLIWNGAGAWVNTLLSTVAFSGSHTDLTGVSSDQHHAQSHAHDGADGSGTVAHSDTTGQGTDDHHAESHTIASHSDTTATGTELETLTDGSNADALHAHAHSATTGQGTDDHHAQSHTLESHSDVTVTTAAQYHVLIWNGASAWVNILLATVARTGAHSDLTGVSSDQHHPQSHTIASHSDTTATGTELNTLTDGSNADALHVHAPHSELTNEILYEHDGGTYEACQPITYAGRYWRLVWVANYGDADFDGHTIAAGKRNFFMQQFCLPIYDVPGYCLYTTPVGELLSFGIPATGETEAQEVEDGILGGIGTEYSGTLSGGDPSTGESVEATFVSGLSTDYEGLIVLGNDTTGESITLRIDSDGKVKQ